VTLGLNYKLIIWIFGGARHHLISDAHAELTHQFLTRTLSVHISSLGVAQRTHQFLMRMLRVRISSWRVWSACFEGTFSNFICALSARISSRLSARISSWPVCSAHASVPDPYAHSKHQFLTRMLSARISSWLVCSVCA